MCSVCEMKGQIYIQIRRVIVSKQLFCRRAIFKRLKIMHSGNTSRDANLPPNGGNPLFCTKILTPEIGSSKSEELISDSIGGSLKLLTGNSPSSLPQNVLFLFITYRTRPVLAGQKLGILRHFS